MKRLFLFARKLDQSGAERQIVILAKSLKGRGYDIHVVPLYAGGVFYGELAAAGVPTQFVGKRGRRDIELGKLKT